MLKKKYVVTAFLTICLTATLLATLSSPAGGGPPWIPYDPWMDINDDGVINILDMKLLKLAYSSTGTPINKTALLLELNASVAELETRVSELEAETLGFTNPPAYDSLKVYGWRPINPDTNIVFEHNLNTTNVLVYLIGNYPDSLPYIHQKDYGGEITAGNYYGVYWYALTNTTIWVHRYKDDTNWDYVRVVIWKIPEPPT